MARDEGTIVEQNRKENPDLAAVGLIYAPTGSRRRKRKPLPLIPCRKPEGEDSKSAEGVKRDDFDDALQYRLDGRNDERAVRAASFLLDWATAEGNEEVDPVLVQGISRALNLAADNIAMTLRRRAQEHRDAGSD